MNNNPLYGQMGTVSHATMREEDLIPRLIVGCDSLHLTRAEVFE